MYLNQYDAYAISTRLVAMIDKKKELERLIEDNIKQVERVYGTTQDGSLGMAYHYQVNPLRKELEALEQEIKEFKNKVAGL